MKALLKGGSQSGDLTQTITSSVKKALLEHVDFTPAEKPASLQVESLRCKYISLNPSEAVPALSNGNNHARNNVSNGFGCTKQDEMPQPKTVLYPPHKVKLKWPNPRRVGPGIQNMGNTCFMNSVLQCLTYTAPFANYILEGEHKSKCRQVGFCAFCEIGNHIMRALNGQENVIRPMVILKNLRYIAKEMSWGKQEDSHEFLRLLLDHIQKSCYKGIPGLDSLSKETTIVNQIYGGFLRSQVLCLKCHHRSSIYEPFLDLSLDIKNVTNIQKALERFVQPDQLEGKNAYKCANCKNTVQAQKRFSIQGVPNVLTLQLKRFHFGGSIFGGSGKMTKHVGFPQKLDLRPYMSVSKGEPVNYHLYGVICHSGYNCNSGHYFAYVCGPNKVWYIMNDSQVSQCQLGRVMSAEAYMLFYLKATPNYLSTSKQQVKTAPQLPTSQTAASTDSKSFVGGQYTPKGQKSPMSSTAPNETTRTPFVPQASKIPPANQRERVSFGIKPPQQQGTGCKPRIVMHIKSGKVVSLSPTKKDKSAEVTSPSKLVPYGDESDSEEDVGVTVKNVKKNGDLKQKEIEARSNDEPKMVKSPEVKKFPGVAVPSMKSKEIHTDKVLNTPPKRYGTLKRSLSADGPLTVNVNTHKVNATPGPWHVSDNNVAQSPSLASDCSNNSVNSTTEWNVVDSKEAPKTPVLPEAQCPGWTVTSPVSKIGTTSDQVEPVELPEAAASKDLPKEAKREENCEPSKEGKQETIHVRKSSDQNALEEGKQSTALETRENGETKKQWEDDNLDVKHQKLDDKTTNGELYEGLNMGKEGGEKQVADRSDEEDNDKHKKYKKHQTERSHDTHEEIDEMHTHEKRKKNKKKKHKKHKHKDEERGSNSDIEGGEKTHSTKKRKHSHESESPEFVWVEKTKESLESGDHCTRKEKKHDNDSNARRADSHNDHQVEVKVWDKVGKINHTEKQEKKCDSYGKSSERRERYNEGDYFDEKRRTYSDSGKSRAWSGSRSNSNVVNELKGNSIFGYGENVQSWEGGQSANDQEVEKDKMIERKRRLEEYSMYDDELDSGRTKKVKRREDYGSNRYGQENPFQRFQDDRNYGRKRWHSHSSGRNGYYSNDRHDRGYKKDKYRSYSDHRPRHYSHGGKPYKKYRDY